MKTLRNYRFIFYSILLSVFIVFIDCLADVYIHHQGTLSQQIFHPDTMEIWMRSTHTLLCLVFGLILHFNFARIEKLKVKAEESSKAKTVFLNQVNHEIRTPLTAIVGFSELLMESGRQLSETEKIKYLSSIKTNADDLYRLLGNILEVSQMVVGELTPNIIETTIQPTVDETLNIIKDKASNKGLKFVAELKTDLSSPVKTDPDWVSKVLGEMLSNALKFTPSGEINIDIHKSEKNNKSFLVFKVKDTGIGVSEEAKRKLFEPFHQNRGSIPESLKGVGAGLARSKYMSEKLGGGFYLIDSKSNGGGSTFEFWLPASS